MELPVKELTVTVPQIHASTEAPAEVAWRGPPASAAPATRGRSARWIWTSASPSRATTEPCAGMAWVSTPATASQATRASTVTWKWTNVPQIRAWMGPRVSTRSATMTASVPSATQVSSNKAAFPLRRAELTFQVQLHHPHIYLAISVLPPCLQLLHQWLLVHYGWPHHCELLIQEREGLKKSHIYQNLQQFCEHQAMSQG